MSLWHLLSEICNTYTLKKVYSFHSTANMYWEPCMPVVKRILTVHLCQENQERVYQKQTYDFCHLLIFANLKFSCCERILLLQNSKFIETLKLWNISVHDWHFENSASKNCLCWKWTQDYQITCTLGIEKIAWNQTTLMFWRFLVTILKWWSFWKYEIWLHPSEWPSITSIIWIGSVIALS